MKYRNQQSGFVSILTVIFFVILMSVLTISFLRLVTDQQTQVLDDDLSKGALAAAQSGVEDAKRGLLYCRGLPAGAARDNCYAALTNDTCPGMAGNAALVSALGLNRRPDGAIQVGDPVNNPINNQRYTCVTTEINTDDVVGSLSETSTTLVPLRGLTTFNQVRFSWHQIGVDATATMPNSTAQLSEQAVPRKADWRSGTTPYVSMARLQFFAYNPTQTLTSQRDSSAAMFLVPYRQSGVGGFAVGSINPNWAGDKRIEIRCAGGPAYMCTATITIPPSAPTRDYYLALKSFYNSSRYKIELLNNGVTVPFNDVQPVVDSTGAAGDVFKRVMSRIEYEGDNFETSNVIESGGAICKDFYVVRGDAGGSTCLGL